VITDRRMRSERGMPSHEVIAVTSKLTKKFVKSLRSRRIAS
jgi:hypothetical protein